MNVAIRAAVPADWEQLCEFPAALPFQSNEFLIAVAGEQVAAFLAWRTVFPGESEILHLETLASFRRIGLARRLLRILKQQPGDLFLEVRASNRAALQLYQSEGFIPVGVRKNYYSCPSEEAIVLKFHS